MSKRSLVILWAIIVAALARLLPHPPNVTPIAAMALFGGACFANRKLAYLVPLAAMLLSDLVLAVIRYDLRIMLVSQPIVYACIVATTMLGQTITNRRSVWQVATTSLASSVLFFLVTNLAVWAMTDLYPRTAEGLATCYTAALPFFRNSLAGDAFFVVVLFGGLALLENRVAWMRPEPEVASH